MEEVRKLDNHILGKDFLGRRIIGVIGNHTEKASVITKLLSEVERK